MVGHTPPKFCVYKHCGGGDVMVLVCHVILKEQVIKRSCDLMRRVYLWFSHTPTKCGGHRHRGSGDIMVLVCHMISQDHAIKGSSNNTSRIPLKLDIILSSLVAINTVVMEI